jgi:hypothetical protein
MFTWMWTRKFTAVTNRLQELEGFRAEHVCSSDLSVRTLETAPDFWQRQQSAFSYLDHQVKRMTRRNRLWASMALLAVLADAAVVVGGFTAFQQFQQLRAIDQIQKIADSGSNVARKSLDKAIDGVVNDLRNPRLNPQEQWELTQFLGDLVSRRVALDQARDTGLDPTIQAIVDAGQTASPQVVEPLIKLLGHQTAAIRMSAAEALGHIGDPRAMDPIHDHLLREMNQDVRQEYIAALANIASQNL